MSGRLFKNPASHITIQEGFPDEPQQTKAEHMSRDYSRSKPKRAAYTESDLSAFVRPETYDMRSTSTTGLASIKQTKAIRQDKAKGIQRICSNSFAVPLLQQKVYTATEFSCDFPIAKFTYFTVRIDRMRILKRVASPMEDRLLTAMKLHPCFARNAIRDKLAPKRLTRIRKMASWRGCCPM